MRAIRIFSLYVACMFNASCKEDEAPPDPEAISEDFCAMIEMCDIDSLTVAFDGSFEGCKADILMDFEEAKDVSDACFDATVAHLSCVGSYQSCEECDMGTADCALKLNEYFYLCLGGL